MPTLKLHLPVPGRSIAVGVVLTLTAIGVVVVSTPSLWPDSVLVSRLQSQNTPGSCDRVLSLGSILASRTRPDADQHIEDLAPVLDCLEQAEGIDATCEMARRTGESRDLAGSPWFQQLTWACIDGLVAEERWDDALDVSYFAIERAGPDVPTPQFREQAILCLVALEREDDASEERQRLASETSECRAQLALENAWDHRGRWEADLTELTRLCLLPDSPQPDRLAAADMLFDQRLYNPSREILQSMNAGEMVAEEQLYADILFAKLAIVEGRPEAGLDQLWQLHDRAQAADALYWLVHNQIHALILVEDGQRIAELYTDVVEAHPAIVDQHLWELAAVSLVETGRSDLLPVLGEPPAGLSDAGGALTHGDLQFLAAMVGEPRTWDEIDALAAAAHSDEAVQECFWIAKEAWRESYDNRRLAVALRTLERNSEAGGATWQLVSGELAFHLAEQGQTDDASALLMALSESRFELPRQSEEVGRIGGAMARLHTGETIEAALRRWKSRSHPPDVLRILRLGAAEAWVEQAASADARALVEPLAGKTLDAHLADRYFPSIVQAYTGDGLLEAALELPDRFPGGKGASRCRLTLAVVAGIPIEAAESATAVERALDACEDVVLGVLEANPLVIGLCALERGDEAMEIVERAARSGELSEDDRLELPFARARVLLAQGRSDQAVESLRKLIRETSDPSVSSMTMCFLLTEVHGPAGDASDAVVDEAERVLATVGPTSGEGIPLLQAAVEYGMVVRRFDQAIQWQDQILQTIPAGSGEPRAWELQRRALLTLFSEGTETRVHDVLAEGLAEAPAGTLVRREIVILMAALVIDREGARGARRREIVAEHATQVPGMTVEELAEEVEGSLSSLAEYRH